MIFRPFLHYDTGCASYLFGCASQGVCCVVDPLEQDVQAMQAFAASAGMAIRVVFETHVHADHRSGARALAAQTGAAHAMQRHADVAFHFTPLDDGQLLEFGNVVVKVLETPGHTTESICLLVSDLRRGSEPWFVCTGDSLFVGAVGRPDLPGHALHDAGRLHDSLREKLLHLPDWIEVWPAHFLGSACGSGMSGKPMSTLGFEKRNNPLLRDSRVDFMATVSGHLPPRPVDLAAIVAFNQGRAS